MTDTVATPSSIHARRVAALGYTGIVAVMIYFGTSSHWEDPFLVIAALAIVVLGAWPTLRWLQRNDDTYPIIEFMLLTTVPFYALPVLTGHDALGEFTEPVVLKAAFVVITFQVAAILGGAAAARTFNEAKGIRTHWLREEVWPEQRMNFTAYTAILNTAWLFLATLVPDLVPQELFGTLRAIAFGIGIVSIFIQARLWGAGRLQTSLKVLFWVNLTVQVILSFSSLVLITGISLLLTAAIGYFTSSRRVPWIPLLIFIPIVGVLHQGKAPMRETYWKGLARPPTLLELPAYFTQWVEFSLVSSDAHEEEIEGSNLTYGLMQRASLYHIVCVAVDTMPERSPFLNGESYAMLPAQFVPRFLWPTKPSPQASVRLLAIHFGLQSEDETKTTSIGFGILSEAYANFGYVSVAVISFILGWLFRRLALMTAHCATLSPAGLFRILCLVWCFNAEGTLAIWISSFYQACIAIGIPLFGLRMFFSK